MRLSIQAASAALDDDAFATGVTAASGVAFTLASNETADGLAHKVIITPTGSVTGNYTIAGKDADGIVVSETLATNTTSVVTSVKHYASALVVTAPAGLGAETVKIGIAAASQSGSVRPAQTAAPFSLGFGCTISGSPTYTVEHSYGDGHWFNHATVAAQSASAQGGYTAPVAAIRLTFSVAGTVTFTGIQSGA